MESTNGEKSAVLSIQATQDSVNQLERYKVLSEGKKVREIAPFELEDFCDVCISSAIINAGLIPLADADMKLMIQELYNDLSNYYPTTSTDQVREAFTLGAKGKLGEFYGINPKTWNKWIEAYLKMAKEHLKLLPKENPTPGMSEQEIHKAKMLLIDKCCQFYDKPGEWMLDSTDLMPVNMAFVNAGIIKENFDAYREDAEQAVRGVEEEKKEMKVPKAERLSEGSADWEKEVLRYCRFLRLITTISKLKKSGFNLRASLVKHYSLQTI